jgi:hypothetical protein
MNDIGKCLALFDGFQPFSGYVQPGYHVDFLGKRIDARCRRGGGDPTKVGGKEITAPLPRVGNDGLFEAVDWLESARAARGHYVMISLGACFGAQAVGAYLALQRLNPMPAKLVTVEADPSNIIWLRKHFADNGINPDDHWILNCALSDNNKPVLFPVVEADSGVSGVGNVLSTNSQRARQMAADQLMGSADLPDLLRDLILTGKTGIKKTLPTKGPKLDFNVEFVSAITLTDVLAPLDHVDLLESDIQQSEIVVFPPAMDLVRQRVKRVHIGSHGPDVHEQLVTEFINHGFEIVFNYPPQSRHETPWGVIQFSDGVITAQNLTL